MFLLRTSTRISYIASHYATIIYMNFIGACPTFFFFNNLKLSTYPHVDPQEVFWWVSIAQWFYLLARPSDAFGSCSG